MSPPLLLDRMTAAAARGLVAALDYLPALGDLARTLARHLRDCWLAQAETPCYPAFRSITPEEP